VSTRARSNVDIDRDELRRQLRDVDVEQMMVATRWRDALKRIFDPDSGIDTATKARILGVPARRQFLKLGGGAVIGAAVLAACSSEGGNATTRSPASSSLESSSAAGINDLTLAKTAASLEALAIATYDTAINSGTVTTAAIGDAVKLFKDHHQQHMDALNNVITAAGAPAVTRPNTAVKSALVDPVVADPMLDEARIVELAYDLEDAAEQTYVYATTAITSAGLRSTLMTISGVEARHKAILGVLVQHKTPDVIIPISFARSDNPLPPTAIIG
jgi:hypothetical protein